MKVKAKINGIKLSNGHIIKPIVLDCCMGTTGEGPPSILGKISKNTIIDTDNSTIVLKSITRYPKVGNFGSSIFSKDGWAMSKIGIPFPKKFCYFSLFGLTINSFGLTNQGIDDFLNTDWLTIRKIRKPVIISLFVEFGEGSEADIEKAYENAVYMMKKIDIVCDKNLLIAVIFNASCPNVKEGVCNTSDAIIECANKMKKAAPNIPLGVKLSYVQPVQLGVRLNMETEIDFIQGINTVPWNTHFPNKVSPLSHIGGGGISGPQITSKALDYIIRLRELIPDAKIIGGGGISNLEDVKVRARFVDSISIAVLVNQKPDIVNKIINYFKV